MRGHVALAYNRINLTRIYIEVGGNHKMLSLLVVSLTCCVRVHDCAGQWVIRILQWLSAPIFTIGDVLSLLVTTDPDPYQTVGLLPPFASDHDIIFSVSK